MKTYDTVVNTIVHPQLRPGPQTAQLLDQHMTDKKTDAGAEECTIPMVTRATQLLLLYQKQRQQQRHRAGPPQALPVLSTRAVAAAIAVTARTPHCKRTKAPLPCFKPQCALQSMLADHQSQTRPGTRYALSVLLKPALAGLRSEAQSRSEMTGRLVEGSKRYCLATWPPAVHAERVPSSSSCWSQLLCTAPIINAERCRFQANKSQQLLVAAGCSPAAPGGSC
jgi:hypothetical protein